MSTTILPISSGLAERLTTIGLAFLRYGLVAILLLIGGLKFTHAEAMGIQPLIAHSPLMSWMYAFGDVDGVSRIIGTAEIIAALLIALRAVLPIASAVGSAMGIFTFVITLSFMISTPGVWDPGFPALSGTGSFLIKDLVLLGASLFTAGEALLAAQAPR
jgi:uncharacterized membrane protein YkgB